MDPFMKNFVNLAYGIGEETSLVFLLAEYEKPILDSCDLINFFGLLTTEGELHSFYDSLTEISDADPLDVFANFALLTEETTKEEIAKEYVEMVHQNEKSAFGLLLPEAPQLSKQN